MKRVTVFLSTSHRLAWVALLLVALMSTPPAWSASFAEIVAERNLRSHGSSTETFPSGGDRINRFNGALAYTVPLGSPVPIGGRVSFMPRLEYASNLWRFSTTGAQVSATLDERFDAGAGWSLSFGELIAPGTTLNPGPLWVFRSPNGVVSRFYQTLHDGDAVVFHTFYTRDGSLLRLTVDGTEAVIASLNGVEKVFAQQPSGDWRFTTQRDIFGNHFQVTYSASERLITDSHGRSHRIVMQADPAGSPSQVIDRVELAAFDGTVATYDLDYSVVTIALPPQDNDPSTPVDRDVAVLTSMTDPVGQVTSFTYHPLSAGSASGRLQTIGLATGGFLDYVWQTVELPKVPGALHAADVVGVAQRITRITKPKKTITGVWQLTMSLDRDRDATTSDLPREATTRIVYPDGHEREYLFSAFAGGHYFNDNQPPVSFYLRDYAFPFSKRNAVPGDTFFEHERVYDAGGQLLRTTKKQYAWASCAGCWDRHPKPSGEQVIYHDSGSLTETLSYGAPDNLGRWGTIHSWSSTGQPATRVTTRSYDHGVPAAGSPWVVAGWNTEVIQQGGESLRVERCVDAATGLVTRKRIVSGATQGANDLIRTYTHHASGALSVTRHYGGDVQPLATGDLCTLVLPSQEQYARYQMYQYGSLASSGWLADDGSIFLETYSATIDVSTGLASTAAEADGFTWTYDYDTLGRRISATPPVGHGGLELTTHQPATATTKASVTVEVYGPDGVTVIEKRRSKIDPLGRVDQLGRWSDGAWRLSTTSFDMMDRTQTVTTPDGGKTRYLDHDASGRPTTVRPPEGAVHDRTYVYGGRSVSETVKIGKTWDAVTASVVEIDRMITTTTDRFGQRIERHTADADGEHRTETYTHGLDGEVRARVVTDGVVTDTLTTPDLTDNRGFQVQTSDGTPIGDYDALGNRHVVDFGEGPVAQIFDRAGRLVEQREGTATGPLWSRSVYAAASGGNDFKGGKLVSSQRVNRNVPHLIGTSEVWVEEAYAYTGDGGSVASRTTTVSAGSQTIFSFVTTQGLDVTGQIASVTFPDCDPSVNDIFTICDPRYTRVMVSERDHGDLVRFYGIVDGTNEPWIDGVVRDASGRIVETTLGNGIVETRTPHVSGHGLGRLVLSHPGSGAFYDSDDAEYDGLGKLVALGAQRYVSEHAYSLAIQPIPNAGSSTPPSTTVPHDPLGQPTRREYRVPARWNLTSGQQEQVTEILVYGPGNRLVWRRVFNDYQVSTYRNSIDRWYLTDPSGRTVREASSLTYYAGVAPQWSNAQVDGVWFYGAGNRSEDGIFLGGRLIGRTDDLPNSPARTFLHRDFFARYFATSSADGVIEANAAPLF
ncbi:MAG: hypothetical protein AAGD38_15440 [Acidobacteriota bacterium]